MTWFYLYDKKVPLIVDYCDKWDTWKHGDNPDILGVIAMVNSHSDPSDDFWFELLGADEDSSRFRQYWSDLIDDGVLVHNYLSQMNCRVVRDRGFVVEFGGLSIFMANVSASSLAFKGVEGVDVFAPFVFDGNLWRCSFYAAP